MSKGWSLPETPSVVVTGASSGIGEATAHRFAREGARLTLLARRSDRLKAVGDQVAALGGEALVRRVDVADYEASRAAIREAEAHYGAIDVLVNNAGFGLYAPLETVPLADVERLFRVNTFGALSCIQSVLPGMRRRGRGLIINVSSIVGKRAIPMTGVYGASKHALQALSDALRIELRGTGIDVSVICPGYTSATEFADKVLDYGVSRKRPRGAGAMTAADVAEVIFACAKRPRREAVLTGSGRALVFLERFMPRLADRAIAKVITVKLPPLSGDVP